MSPTEICNLALAHLGEQKINSIDGSSTNEGLCKTFYHQARQEALETLPWTFARERARLTNLSEAPAFKWAYQAQLPSDCLRVLSVRVGEDADVQLDQFEVKGGKLLSQYEYTAIFYIKDITETTYFTANFRAALARLLAHYLALSITGDSRAAMTHRQVYETADLPKAQYLDAVQDQSNENHGLEEELSRSVLIGRRSRGNTGT